MKTLAEVAEHEARHVAVSAMLGRAVRSVDAARAVTWTDDGGGDLTDAIIFLIPGASRWDVEHAEAICARLGIDVSVPAFIAAALLAEHPGFVARLGAEVARSGFLAGEELAAAWDRARSA